MFLCLCEVELRVESAEPRGVLAGGFLFTGGASDFAGVEVEDGLRRLKLERLQAGSTGFSDATVFKQNPGICVPGINVTANGKFGFNEM